MLIKVTALEECEKHFLLIANHPDIRWSASAEGCEARADFIAELLLNQYGLESEKIWARPAHNGYLQVYLNHARTESVQWNYHVANAIQIVDGDTVEDIILDPALFTEAVSIDVWQSRIRADSLKGNSFQKSSPLAYHRPFSYEGDADYREDYMIERDEVLKQHNDLHVLPTLTNHVKYLRAQFVDNLQNQNPNAASRLIHVLNHNQWFDTIWRKSWIVDDFKKQIISVGYLNLPYEEISDKFDLNNPLLQWQLLKNYWEDAVNISEHVTNISNDLQNLSNASSLAERYKEYMQDQELHSTWNSPFGRKLWNQFGLII